MCVCVCVRVRVCVCVCVCVRLRVCVFVFVVQVLPVIFLLLSKQRFFDVLVSMPLPAPPSLCCPCRAAPWPGVQVRPEYVREACRLLRKSIIHVETDDVMSVSHHSRKSAHRQRRRTLLVLACVCFVSLYRSLAPPFDVAAL